MAQPEEEFDPFRGDPDLWGASLALMAELLLACLDAAAARSVCEVGALAGDLTRVLLRWAGGAGARVVAIDPLPQDGLVALEGETPALELICRPSIDVLAEMPPTDAVILDGDHNYHTVSEELRLIGDRAAGAPMPLVLLHDVCWPHARRDFYYNLDAIPAPARQPLAAETDGIYPGDPGTRPDGLVLGLSAAREGGPRNGVLTAVEDFVGARDRLRLVVVPTFYGFGAIWSEDAPYNEALARVLDPWDRNPILARLERSRIHHLAESHARQVRIWALERRQSRYETLLRRMLESSAFAVAERLSALRVRAGIATGQTAVSRDEIRRAIDS